MITKVKITAAAMAPTAGNQQLYTILDVTDQELKDRLVGRGTEEESVIDMRLSRAWQEAQGVENYDYFVINDDLPECVGQVHAIIQNEHARTVRNQTLIDTIRADLKCFAKGE